MLFIIKLENKITKINILIIIWINQRV